MGVKKTKKAALKTTANARSVEAFLGKVKDARRAADCRRLVTLLTKITGEKPKMWGSSLVGFGTYHYVYASGREGDWPLAGFSPRKQDLTVYVMAGFEGQEALLSKLGPHKLGKSCLYLKGLEGVDESALVRLVTQSVAAMRKLYR
jgi:hypothetical protein